MANSRPDGPLQPQYSPLGQSTNHVDFVEIASRAMDKNVDKRQSVVAEKDVSSLSSASHFLGKAPDTYTEQRPRLNSYMPVTQPGYWTRKTTFALRYLAVVVLIGLPLAIPVILFNTDQAVEGDSAETRQYHNLVFYLFLWLLVTWLSTCVANILTHIFPYIFKFVAGYVNSAHKKYWRVFRVMRLPVTLLASAISGFAAFYILINSNERLIVSFGKDFSSVAWDDALADILFSGTLWAALYLVEKIIVLYITIHYHYRTDSRRIEKSKRLQRALGTLYEASVYLHPLYSDTFLIEDSIIHSHAVDRSECPNHGAGLFLQKLGIGSRVSDAFGRLVNPDGDSHWFQPSASYAIVGRALEHPKSAAALGIRIWASIVAEGKDALTEDDIAEALGPHSREQAHDCFQILDENENKDIRLNEMVMTTVEAGRIRHAIFQGMHDINHAINTFDWVSLLIIAASMILFVLLVYVPKIREIKDTVGFAALGISFALGRTIHKFLSGCIFIFFEHAYDIGDRVEIYNIQSNTYTSAIVTRISVLYTIFRRVDNGKDLQLSNDRLNLIKIENVSRSDANREALSIFVDFGTTFKDIQHLREELQSFLSDPANTRDYQPALNLRIAAIHEMEKLELKCSYVHKSNWSNEPLRAGRSSKFMCALVAAVRKIPIYRPGHVAAGLGDEGKPSYTVMISDQEAAAKREAVKQKNLEKRADYFKEAKPEMAYETQVPGSEPLTGEASAEQVAELLRKKEEEDQASAMTKEAREAADKEAEDAAFNRVAGFSPSASPALRHLSESATTGVDPSAFPFVARVSTGLRKNSRRSP